jgi:stringent starvation protein B
LINMIAHERDTPSTRPYLIRALHEWCTDNGFAPHLAVHVDASVQVPHEYVKNGEIVLNVSFDATSSLRLGNDVIEFKARFGGVARDIMVPVTHVVAIYARENGQGMAFPFPSAPPSDSAAVTGAPTLTVLLPDLTARNPLRAVPVEESSLTTSPEPDDEPPQGGAGRSSGRPQLKRVK